MASRCKAMKLLRRSVFVCLMSAASAACAQDPKEVWSALSQPMLDAGRFTTVKDSTLVRDRIRITLSDGAIQFLMPANGVVFGAVFRGTGRLQVQPPNPMEAQQLRLLAKVDTLDLEFTDAVFTFTDGTYEEIAGKAQWATGVSAAPAAEYIARQQEREDVGAELLPRLYKSVLSADRKRSALFAADLKTAKKGWLHVRFDALDPEEVSVGHWIRSTAVATRWTVFETWLSFPAGNRFAGEAFHDPLEREDSLLHGYVLNVTVSEDEVLSATARVNVDHRAGGERVLLFLLDANLRVESVRDAQGHALAFFQPRDPKDRDQSYGDYVAVVLPELSKAGQSQAIEFKYAGKRVIRKMGQGNYFCQSYGWYPTRANSFAARADFEINFRSPKKYILTATGNKISETTDGDQVISRWQSGIPLAVAGFAFGDYKLHTEKAGAVEVEIYANRNPDDFMMGIKQFLNNPFPFRPDIRVYGTSLVGSLSPAALVKTMGTEVSNTLRVFENYFGPYPYKKLAVTNIPYAYGQGWPGLVYLSALSFLNPTQMHALGLSRYGRELTDFFRAHESSHQWWGHRVGWKSYHDQWLSEGFAQFSGNLYVQYRQKDEKEYLTRLRKDKEELFGRDPKNRTYESLGPVWMGRRLQSADAPRGYATVVYNKGGYVLHMLRMMLFDASGKSPNPDQRFMNMMQDFTRTYDNKPASTEDFKAVAERHMTPPMNLEGNGKLDWFFQQYVYGTGIPHYEFRYSMQPAESNKWKISGTITQSNVPEGWKDILPIYIHTGGRAILLGWTRAAQRENKLEFTLPMKPDKISLNFYEDIFAEIKQ